MNIALSELLNQFGMEANMNLLIMGIFYINFLKEAENE